MSERLQRFRKMMEAFEGAADPAKTLAQGYYVHAPGKLLVDQITNRIALRPASSHLLIGGIGTGKTTQLLMAQQQLQEIEDITAHYVDVSQHTDIQSLKPGLLIAIAGLELCEFLPAEEVDSLKQELEAIKKVAYGYTESVSVPGLSTQLSTQLLSHEKRVKHQGLLTPKSSYTGQRNLEKSVQKIFNRLLQTSEKKWVFIFDGLDRIQDLRTFSEVIRADLQFMVSMGIGVIMVGPAAFLYAMPQNDDRDLTDKFYCQPCFDVERDSEVHNFFSEVLRVRLPDTDFLTQEVMRILILYSGGILRDLIKLTEASIEEVYASGDEVLEVRHLEKAVYGLGRNKLLGISGPELDLLHKAIESNNFVFGSPESISLVSSGRVIEYQYPETRYAVHPVLRARLQPSVKAA